jgi:V/A-type H+/Na+-transporting ATPase subunit I
MFRPKKVVKAISYIPLSAVQATHDKLFEHGICHIDISQTSSEEYDKQVELLEYTKRLILRLSPFKKPEFDVLSHHKIVENFLAQLDIESQKHLASLDSDTKHKQEKEAQIDVLELLPDVELASKHVLLNPTHEQIHALSHSIPYFFQFIGFMPTLEFEQFQKKIKSSTNQTIIQSKVYSKTENLILVHTSQNLIDELFTHGFRKAILPNVQKSVKQALEELKLEVAKYDEHMQKHKLALSRLAQIQSLANIQSELELKITKMQGVMQSLSHNSFAQFSVWIDADTKEDFVKLLPKTHLVQFEEDDAKAPTKLHNGWLARPFELITRLYSVPKSQGFDPTFFIALSFPIFFGIMLTDVAYGIALALIASIFFVKAQKKNDTGMSGFMLLLLISAISTIIFGAIFGSYFGNFFQMMGLQVPMVLDSMKDIIPMIVLVLSIGIIHITLGLIIGFSEAIRAKEYKQAMQAQGLWLIFVLAVLVLIAHALLPAFVVGKIIGLSLLGVALLLQFTFAFLQDGPIKAVLSLFDFSGFLGDVFSYIRLMALAIGTSGIALAVNFMVFLAYDMIPYVGILFAALIFIVGHAFNMAMNGLGAFIHTLRLHFLEHFSKYYEGGGREFTPYGKK